MTADIVGPGRCHGSLKGTGIILGLARRRDSFDSAELRERVDSVCLERLDELADGLVEPIPDGRWLEKKL